MNINNRAGDGFKKPGDIVRHEDKPFVETDQEGVLNLNSYAAMAAFGLAELAVETLYDAEEPVTGPAVYALAETFSTVIAATQRSIGARVNMQDGLHARLRGALRTSLRTLPVPFGAEEAAWGKWAADTERRLRSIWRVAEDLWGSDHDPDARPWKTLAITRPMAVAS